MSRMTSTIALPGPSVCVSIASSPPPARVVALLRPLLGGFAAAGGFGAARGHSSWPLPSVMVTLLSSRPGTLEATSCAMPRTEPGSSQVVPDSSTAALAWVWLEANSCGWGVGSTSCTCAPLTPCTLSIVSSSWPCRARW